MRAALLVVITVVAACQPRTEIVIGFATDYAAPVPLDEIKLGVIRQDGFPEGGDGLTWTLSGAPDAPYNLPASYGIYSDGQDVQLDVSLSGMSNGSAIVSQTVTLSLVGDQTLFYRMGLTAECQTTTCSPDTTCMEGKCVTPAVPVLQLPTYTPDLVTELTCIPPVVHYKQTATGADMPYSADAAECPPDLCVQGLCLKPPGSGTSASVDTYLKPGAVSAGASYGGFSELAMSADGNTVVVGGWADDLVASAGGGVYVYSRSGTTWSEQAHLKSSNEGSDDGFGSGVAISADGSTIAIGAIGESSDSTGINGNETQNPSSSPGTGAVYVFARSGPTWTQTTYIKPSTVTFNSSFGNSVALSQDGTTLAVGEFHEDSTTSGIDSTPNQAGNETGAVFVFTQSSGTWSQQAYIKAAVTHADDHFGYVVALSGDGSTLAVGAENESSASVGVGGDPTNTNATDAGAAYVFTRAGTTWSQDAYIKASNTRSNALFGGSVALSSAGTELVVGSPSESSAATGIGGNQADTSAAMAGAAYVFTQTGGVWSQQSYVKASNTATKNQFGVSVGLSGDGNTLLIGSMMESSNATGLDGNQQNASAAASGAAYLFGQSGATWSQQHYVKASNTRTKAYFGYSTAASSDGSTYAVGAPGDSSAATGVDGNQSGSSAANEGAVYVFPP